MNLSAFIIRIAFIALPGLLASTLYRKARGRTTKKNWEDFFEVMIFSLVSYLLLALIVSCHNCYKREINDGNITRPESLEYNKTSQESSSKRWSEITFFKTFSNEQAALNWCEIGYASLIGLTLAVIASYLHTYSIITWLLRIIRATNRVADEDIWELFHNSKKTNDWLFIRDHKLNLIYFGYIARYSDSGKERELVIDDVSVFDENSVLLYECPSMYVSRKNFDLTIEIITKQ